MSARTRLSVERVCPKAQILIARDFLVAVMTSLNERTAPHVYLNHPRCLLLILGLVFSSKPADCSLTAQLPTAFNASQAACRPV